MSAPVRRRSGFQRLAVVTTLATLVLIAVGGAVRATGSGLACPDWPFCYGRLVPGQVDIPPGSGYALWQVWLEHSHRLLASVVGVLVLALAVWAAGRFRRRTDVLVPVLAALVLVAAQAWLGRQVVAGRLPADLVTTHLGMALAVAGCLVVAAVHADRPRRRGGSPVRWLAWSAAAAAALAYMQALVGAAVSGHGAGLVFTDFPLMGGAVVPRLSSLAAVLHAAHRYLAVVLLLAVTALCAAAVRGGRRLAGTAVEEADRQAVVRLPMRAATLVVVQVLLGAANLWWELSAWTVVPHLAVASWIWTLLVAHAALVWRVGPLATVRGAPEDATGRGEPVAASGGAHSGSAPSGSTPSGGGPP